MRFGAYFNTAELPTPPSVIGRPWLIRNWGLLGNDVASDCVWAGFAHEVMMLYADANTSIPTFTTREVLKDYHAATGPDDEGTDLQEACAYRQKTGISDILGHRHAIDIYTALTPGDLKQIALTVFLFGFAGIGLRLPTTAETQFKYQESWSVEPGADVKGGHYVPCVGRNSLGDYLVVTWGRLHAVTPDFIEEYMDQGVAIISRERLTSSGLSPQGYNLSQLEDDFRQLTGA